MFYGWRVTAHPAMQQAALPDWEAAFSHVKTVKGGAIYNDDYFMFKGCYDAVQEFRRSKASRPMRSSLFFNEGDYQEFPEGSLECVAPAMNGHEYQETPEGSCSGRKVNGGILRVE